MLSAQEIYELEKKWIRYKVRQNIKKISAVSFILFIAGAGGYIYLFNPNIFKQKEKKIIKKEKKIVIADEKIKEFKKPIKEVSKKQKKEKVLTLNTDFIQKIEKKKEILFKNPPLPAPKIQKFKLSQNSEKEEKPKIKIISKKVDTITFLKKRFESTNDINYALMLSSAYYEKKNYKKALYWAIKANEIDPSNERSWILFAKAKIKLGKKREAIKALKIYLKNRESRRVFNVLEKIQNGDIRG